MIKFVRHSNKKIINTSTRKFVSERYIYRIYKTGENVQYIDSISEADLLPKVISRYENKKYKLKKDDPELGPFTPLNQIKYYKCKECDTLTPNRFRCSPCWEKISDITAGYFDSYDYGVSPELGIV
jgi:hypothetical protein